MARTEQAILQDINMVYGRLSPENLHCDGEISRTTARRKAAVLNQKLKMLFIELGRKVDECEVFERLSEAEGADESPTDPESKLLRLKDAINQFPRYITQEDPSDIVEAAILVLDRIAGDTIASISG